MIMSSRFDLRGERCPLAEVGRASSMNGILTSVVILSVLSLVLLIVYVEA